jgi:hypothetical protein
MNNKINKLFRYIVLNQEKSSLNFQFRKTATVIMFKLFFG